MAVTTTSVQTVRQVLNRAIPDTIFDALRKLRLGDLLAVLLNSGATAVPALTSSQNATTNGVDATTTQALANALKVSYNALQVDVAAIRTALLGVGGTTQQAATVTSSVLTLTVGATAVFQVTATAGTTLGVKTLVGPNITPVTGQVSWDGNTKLTFATVDAVTAATVTYAKVTTPLTASVLEQQYPTSTL